MTTLLQSSDFSTQWSDFKRHRLDAPVKPHFDGFVTAGDSGLLSNLHDARPNFLHQKYV